jgi:hypothetical protein
MFAQWHDAADGPRTFYALQNSREEHWKHQSEGGNHMSSFLDTAQEAAAVCSLKISVFNVWLLDRYNRQECQMILSIILDKLNTMPVRVPYHASSY